MDRLDAIRLFVRAVESGSFAAAARAAGIGQPAVSKQIAALEQRLGAQLLRRTSRSMALTEAGQTYYESAVRLIGDFEAAESLIGRGQAQPSGLVRVSVAPVFGRLCVVPRLAAFLALYPDISIELSSSERNVNLIEEGFDLGIRIGELADSSMRVRKLATAPLVTVATPAYLASHGIPATPGDLERHVCVVFLHHGELWPWVFAGESGPILHLPKGNFRTADAEQILAAALAGLGLAHAPGYLFAAEIASGALRVVLHDDEPAPLPINVVHAAGRRLPTKVRVLVDFLAQTLPQDPSLASN